MWTVKLPDTAPLTGLLDRPAQRLPIDVLRDVFGYDSFPGQQAEIIDHVIAGNDALVLMPTGGERLKRRLYINR